MISRLQIEALRVPAFYVESSRTGSQEPFLHNVEYGETFLQRDGPLERLGTRGWSEEMVWNRALDEFEEAFVAHRTVRWWRISLIGVGAPGSPAAGVLGLCADVTATKLQKAAMESALYEDGLTGAGNRRRFDLDLSNAIATAKMTGQRFSVVVADIDKFKSINDEHGHQAGDAALKAVAEGMQAALRKDDTIYRIGGDEFAALIGTSRGSILSLIRRRIEKEIDLLPKVASTKLSLSVGGAVWSEGSTAKTILEAADANMYQQKRVRHLAFGMFDRPTPCAPPHDISAWPSFR